MKLIINVKWRDYTEQGREFQDKQWKPNSSIEIVYLDSPVLFSQIEQLITQKYRDRNCLIELNGIKVIDE